MKTTKNDHGYASIAIIGFVLIVGLMVFGIWAAGQASDDCKAAGGSMHSSTSTGFGVNPANGQPVSVTTTTSTCLTPDGRIITDY